MAPSPPSSQNGPARNPDALIQGFEQLGYIADRALATALYLAIELKKPLLIEGHSGLGKTEVAKVLASFLGAQLIRLQCYEGLDINSAVYEWNYQKQLLSIKIEENSGETVEQKERHIFSEQFLLERPLLQAIRAVHAPPVLLIDEVDRADEPFEAFLLELLSDFQISVPEMGTIKARHIPHVVLTSNRTRELSEALRRRCLYHWIDYPDFEKEMKIVHARLPEIGQQLSSQVVRFVRAVRHLDLSQPPGVAETLDCTHAVSALDKRELDVQTVEDTISCVVKTVEDAEKLKSAGIDKMLTEAV